MIMQNIEARILPPEEKWKVINNNFVFTEWCGFIVIFFSRMGSNAIAHFRNEPGYKDRAKQLMEAVESSEDFTLDSMPNILSSIGGPRVDENPERMYVLTNKSNHYGAGKIISRAARKKIREVFPDGAYLLPSSIHEWLIVDKGPATPEDLLDVVKTINSSLVKTDGIFLADNVYEIVGDELKPLFNENIIAEEVEELI